MTPRSSTATSAYSFNSDTLDGLDSTSFGQLSTSNTWTGNTLWKASVNGASTFNIQDATGSDILNVNSATESVAIGSAADPGGKLYVLPPRARTCLCVKRVATILCNFKTARQMYLS